MKPLYAFWWYDLFPYVLGGHVTDMDDKGRVKIEEYFPTSRFKPIKILPKEAGEKLHEQLKELKFEFRSAKEELLEEFQNKLDELMPEANIYRNNR